MAGPSESESESEIAQLWRISMATWREEFTRLSDIHGKEWQKFIQGENNQQAVCNSMDGVAEMLRR